MGFYSRKTLVRLSGTSSRARLLRPNPPLLLLGALSLYVAFGMRYLRFDVDIYEAVAAIAVAAGAELALYNLEAYLQGRPPRLFFPTAALTAAMGICIFFRALSPWFFAFAALWAIASKYLIRLRGRHIFNPSNFGILFSVFLFPYAATIEFTQWGHDPLVFALIAGLSFFIAWSARVWVTTLSFLASYAVALIALLPYLPATLAVHQYGLLGPSLVLFASFMITDPKTSPSGFYPRILHGMSVALLYFFLELSGARYSLFIASFLISIVNVFSAWFLDALRARAALAQPMPQNILSIFIASCLFLAAAGGAIIKNPAAFPWYRLSPRFIALGVESGELLWCKNPTLTPSPDSGLAQKARTFGAAWGDYDSDGYDDIFVSHLDQPSRLYRNNGNGTFTDVTVQSGLPLLPSSTGYFADYDNDGRPDLFVTFYSNAQFHAQPVQAISVFRNVGNGRFKDVTASLGLSTFMLPRDLAYLSFGDYRKNGKLDFVFTYPGFADYNPHASSTTAGLLAFQKQINDPFFNNKIFTSCDGPRCTVWSQPFDILPGVSNFFFLSPKSRLIKTATFERGAAYLFVNQNNAFAEERSFTEQIQALENEASSTLMNWVGSSPVRFLSGRFFQPVSFSSLDGAKNFVFIPSDFGRSLLLENTGGLHFSDITANAGLAYGGTAMGMTVGDYDHSGNLDMVVNNANTDYEYRSDGSAYALKLSPALKELGVPWGLASFDYDLDGNDDLFAVEGTFSDTPEGWAIGRPLYTTDQLYKNLGNGNFQNVTGDAICPSSAPGETAAVSDYSNTGSPGLFVGNTRFSGDELFANSVAHGTAHFIEIRLHGDGANDTTQGIGAIVSVTSQGKTQEKEVIAGSGFGGEDSLALVFGLGASTEPVRVTVRWPSGRESVLPQESVDRIVTIRQ